MPTFKPTLRAVQKDANDATLSIFELNDSMSPKIAQKAMLRFVRDALADNETRTITITKNIAAE